MWRTAELSSSLSAADSSGRPSRLVAGDGEWCEFVGGGEWEVLADDGSK